MQSELWGVVGHCQLKRGGGREALGDLDVAHLDVCTEVGVLGHMVVLFLIFGGASISFSVASAPFPIPMMHEGPPPPHLHQRLSAVLRVTAALTGMRCHLIGFDLHFSVSFFFIILCFAQIPLASCQNSWFQIFPTSKMSTSSDP